MVSENRVGPWVGPFGSPASQKIDRVEYKKVANELLSCLPHSLQNNVTVRAPFARAVLYKRPCQLVWNRT